MITVRETVSLNSSPSEIWSVIGAFDSLDSWHPGVASSETVQDGTDKIRHLTLGDGSKIVERLDSHDDDARRYITQSWMRARCRFEITNPPSK